jgi:hypothetical protein
MKTSKRAYAIVKGIKTNVELITSVQNLLDHIQHLESEWDTNNLWFRGLSHASYDLVPSIYRETIWKYSSEDANEVYTEFLRRAKPFIRAENVKSRWEWFNVMQHYGVPTRLLDWTEGALFALFFALRKVDDVDVPCVWVLDPIWLNKVSTNKEMLYYTDPTYQERIDRKILRYLEDEAKLPDYPVAVLPGHIDIRIISQKSVFTIHGRKKNGYLDVTRKHKGARILKLRIDSKRARDIRQQLDTIGITETALFPDLEGLAREIKWDYEMR